MHIYQLDALLAQMSADRRAHLEFLRVPAMSLGIYRLRPGETDRQQPHTEQEAYFVIAGRAKFRVAGEEQPVSAGTVLFVEKGVEHRFLDVTESLVLLVFFAPAEGTARAS